MWFNMSALRLVPMDKAAQHVKMASGQNLKNVQVRGNGAKNRKNRI